MHTTQQQENVEKINEYLEARGIDDVFGHFLTEVFYAKHDLDDFYWTNGIYNYLKK